MIGFHLRIFGFETIAVKERKNKRLQQQMLLLRFQDYMLGLNFNQVLTVSCNGYDIDFEKYLSKFEVAS